MRSFCIATLLTLLFAEGAQADPTQLYGGGLITHYVPDLTYSSDPPALGWCGEYMANHAISSFEETVCRIDVQTFLPCCWFVIAAWEEEKIWCGTEFGFDDYNPNIFLFTEYSPCYPPDGGLEIPTPGWPGPLEGIAFVVTGAPWEGNFVPVMFFGGYAYAYAGPGLIPVGDDPATGFTGFSNCAAPPVPFTVDWERRGGMGINMDGICFGGPPPTPGACCFDDGHCEFHTEDMCYAVGGYLWLGPWVPCDPNPCLQTGACCLPEPPGECQVMYEEDCLLVGGEWLGPGTDCEGFPCGPPVRVCCHDCGECTLVFEEECEALFGVYHP